MAEFIMKDRVEKLGLSSSFVIESRGTSYEEEGNDLYPPAKRKLDEKGISYSRHYASRLEKEDYSQFDYFICMERRNIYQISKIFDDPLHKVQLLLDKDISDPWYSGDFESTYQDLCLGIDQFLHNEI